MSNRITTFKMSVLNPNTDQDETITICGTSPQDFHITKGGDWCTEEYLQIHYIDEVTEGFILALGLDY